MFIGFINCCLFFVLSHLFVVIFGFATTSQLIIWEDHLRNDL